MENRKVCLVKFNESAIGKLVHLGGITSAEIASTPYLDNKGRTKIKVIWDNSWEMHTTAEIAMDLQLRKYQQRVRFLNTLMQKVTYLKAIPNGTEIAVEGVCGGKTTKISDPFHEDGYWKIRCKYYDQGFEPGVEYVERVKHILVKTADYVDALKGK